MKNLSFLFFFLMTLSSLAQDKIFMSTGDTIKCTILEIGGYEIKYFYSNNPKIIFGIDKSLVNKVEYSSNQKIQMEKTGFNNSDNFTHEIKHALKINLLSPLIGSTELTYEQCIKSGKSWEAALGIIGLGVDQNEINPKGVYGKIALKLIKTPNNRSQKKPSTNFLKGGYIASEIAVRYCSFDQTEYNSSYPFYYFGSDPYNTFRNQEYAFALTVKIGKQWVIKESFLFDLFFGTGYAISKINEDTPESLPYGFTVGNEEIPIALTGGLRIGWVF